MKQHIAATSKYLLANFVPAKVIQSRLHKRVFMQFAERLGMVYFGYVDQRSDEHRLIRGLTVSAAHRDNHYCIGNFDGYDVALVERVDTLRFPGKPAKKHEWIIMTFDLRTHADMPHVFLGLHTHSDLFYAHLFTKFSQLIKAPLGTFGMYDPAFTQRYVMYTEPAQSIAVERVLDPAVTKVIADTFGSLTVEIADGCLYVYAEHQRPTVALLEKMLKHGAWLAQAIDTKSIGAPETN
jgi:hypothetical protein